MKKNTVKCLNEIKFAEGDPLPVNIQLLRIGEFNHFWYGKFIVNEMVLKQLKANFDTGIVGRDCAIDLEHAGTNHSTEAAAWIKNVYLDNSDSELWATVEWTPLGQEKIQNKQYRYFSAEYDTAYEDAEQEGLNHGYVLLGAGLTNRPFIKRMQPTSKLSEKLKEEKVMEEKLKELELNNKALSEKLDRLASDNKNLSEALKGKDSELKALKEEQVKVERTMKFNEMLVNKKVCEAQREAWMSQDMVKFAELSNPVNINVSEKGSDDPEVTSKEKESDVEKKFDAEIEKVKDEKKLSYSEAVKVVLSENKEYREWFARR